MNFSPLQQSDFPFFPGPDNILQDLQKEKHQTLLTPKTTSKKMRNIGFRITNQKQTEKVFIAASDIETLRRKGIQKLGLDSKKKYSIVHGLNKHEETINEWKELENLPKKTLLKLKQEEVNEPDNQSQKPYDRVENILEELENNMDYLSKASGNELKLLADMDTHRYSTSTNFGKKYGQTFLERISYHANQMMMMTQQQKDIQNLLDILSPSKQTKETHSTNVFPTPPIPINTNLISNTTKKNSYSPSTKEAHLPLSYTTKQWHSNVKTLQ